MKYEWIWNTTERKALMKIVTVRQCSLLWLLSMEVDIAGLNLDRAWAIIVNGPAKMLILTVWEEVLP